MAVTVREHPRHFLIRGRVDDDLCAAEANRPALRRHESFDDAAARRRLRARERRRQRQRGRDQDDDESEGGSHPISLWSIAIRRSIDQPDDQGERRAGQHVDDR